MISRLALLSSSVLQTLARTIARVPPSLWLKLGIIAGLIAIKQGALQ